MAEPIVSHENNPQNEASKQEQKEIYQVDQNKKILSLDELQELD